MGSCYSGDHIAEDHIQTDITTCNIEEPQQKYRLGMASNSILKVCKFSQSVKSKLYHTENSKTGGQIV